MDCILWNSISAGKKEFMRHARELIAVHNPSILAIVEPRISGLIAERVLRKLRSPKCHAADPVGYAGGIWLTWDDAVVQVTVIISSPQLLHVLVKPKDSEEFLMTVDVGTLTASPFNSLTQLSTASKPP